MRWIWLLVGVAAAGEPADHVEKSFRDMDRDGDGKLARTEWRGRPRAFDRMDRNGDGMLTLAEVRAARAESGALSLVAALAELDADKDLKISRAEWEALDGFFPRFDLDQDGAIGRREFHEGQRKDESEAMRAHFAQWDKDGDKKLARREHRASGPLDFERRDLDDDGFLSPAEWEHAVAVTFGGIRFVNRLFETHDKNKDAKLQRAEWKAFLATFETLDRNQDGHLAPPEIPPNVFPRRLSNYAYVWRFDRDRDGRVTKKEWRGTNDLFTSFDTDGDGAITRKDFRKEVTAEDAENAEKKKD